jgi:hypothetical protein
MKEVTSLFPSDFSLLNVIIIWCLGLLALLVVAGLMLRWTRNAQRRYKDQQVIMLDQKPTRGIVIACLLATILLTIYVSFIPWVLWQVVPLIPAIFYLVPLYALIHYALPRLRFWVVNESTIVEQLFSTKKTMGWYEIEKVYHEVRRTSSRSIENLFTGPNEYFVLRSLDGRKINMRLNAFHSRGEWGYVEQIIEQRLPDSLKGRRF